MYYGDFEVDIEVPSHFRAPLSLPSVSNPGGDPHPAPSHICFIGGWVCCHRVSQTPHSHHYRKPDTLYPRSFSVFLSEPPSVSRFVLFVRVSTTSPTWFRTLGPRSVSPTPPSFSVLDPFPELPESRTPFPRVISTR